MDDYSYLEDVGRHVGDVGVQIAKLGRGPPKRGTRGGRGRKRGRGRGRGAAPSGRDGEVAGPENQSDSSSENEEDQKAYGGEDVAPNGLKASRGHGLAPPQSNLETLQKQLALKDIKVDFLPEGMEKRKQNQSSWNAR